MGSSRWKPWGVLRRSPELVLRWADLDGAHGAFQPPATIWLDANVTSTERRCALAHELVHAERRLIGPAGHPLMAREEAIVRAEVARRLVPAEELAVWVVWMVEHGHPVDVGAVAEEWDVTPAVAHEALTQLTRQQVA